MKRQLKIAGQIVRGGLEGAAIALLSLGLIAVPILGCTQQQRIDVAQEIVNWTPTLVSAADTVNATVEALDPASALILSPITQGINVLAPQFELAAKNYLANPSQTTLQVLQSLIVQIQQGVNQALLSALKITNPTSQATVTKNLDILATAASALISLIQGISSQAQVTAMSREVTVHLAQVRPLMDEGELAQASARITRDLGTQPVSVDQFFSAEAQAGF